MDLNQLYYTSCRSGLSGYAGYQFNAVTPGVSVEVMNEVEALSSYEPPATLGHTPTPEEIRACPVNLCFVPGPRPIVANVVFTGTDYSGRFGNYFAHALVPAAGAWDGPPPIELWRAPVWARETATGTELPPVREPLATGPIGRRGVDGFLDRAAGRNLLPALLAAVERAVLDEERSVVIHAADADEVAHWIAAVSYLLPPSLTGRMSFATYQFRPSYSRRHVIGSLPGADLVADERAFKAFYLFDFTTGRASEVEVGPLPLLLAAAGTVAAEGLWRRASVLGAGGETRLSDWYAPASAAALLDGGIGVGPGELDVVCAWLEERAAHLTGQTVAAVAAAVLGHDAVSAAQLTRLAAGAAAGGRADLLADAERRLVTLSLAGITSAEDPRSHSSDPSDPLSSHPSDTRMLSPGVPDARLPSRGVPDARLPSRGVPDARLPSRGVPDARLLSPLARAFAADQYARALAGADAAAAVRILRLATVHDVRPDPRALHICGLHVIGPQLLHHPEPPTSPASGGADNPTPKATAADGGHGAAHGTDAEGGRGAPSEGAREDGRRRGRRGAAYGADAEGGGGASYEGARGSEGRAASEGGRRDWWGVAFGTDADSAREAPFDGVRGGGRGSGRRGRRGAVYGADADGGRGTPYEGDRGTSYVGAGGAASEGDRWASVGGAYEDRAGEGVGGALGEVVRYWAEVREGVLACLEEAAGRGRSLREVVTPELAEALSGGALERWPAVRREVLLVRARARPERRVETALRLLSGRDGLGTPLLRELWPDGWPVSDALDLLNGLPGTALSDPALVPWVAAALEGPPGADRERPEAFAELCELVSRLPLADRLPSGPRHRVAEMARIRATERRLDDARGEKEWRAAAEELLAAYGDGPPVVRNYLRARLLARMRSEQERVPVLLTEVPVEVAEAYLEDLSRRLAAEKAPAAAAAFATLYAALARKRTAPAADAIQDVLLRALPDWRRSDLNEVEHELRGRSNRIADEFRRWRATHCRSRRRWLPGWPPIS